MSTRIQQLGLMVQRFRMAKELSQTDLAGSLVPPTSRTTVALLEQGRRLPDGDVLVRIFTYLGVPNDYWEDLSDDGAHRILGFEHALSELVGRPLSLESLDDAAVKAARGEIMSLLDGDLTLAQTFDTFRSLLVYYGVHPPSRAFFDEYFDADSFRTAEVFDAAVTRYQKDAIRLYATLSEAYLRIATAPDVKTHLEPLRPRSDEEFRERTEWTRVVELPEERLADLGYIAAEKVRKESNERAALRSFLLELAEAIRSGGAGELTAISEKKRRKMDSLLRKFDPGSRHSLFSPLFLPDADQLERKAEQIAPKEESDLVRMKSTQSTAQENLAHYLAADHLDVYVATSMRSDADFVSVNRFVSALFRHPSVRPLKLRYFNPTQSWIDDRVAKGLVEALMLKRASMTIYMAQKEDTFGKDSEASVALSQGKPVIVYVPKLVVPEVSVDTEVLGRADRNELEVAIRAEGTAEDSEFDQTVDEEALHGRLLTIRLNRTEPDDLRLAVRRHWADFDLYGEDARIENADERAAYRAWLDEVIKRNRPGEPPRAVRERLVGILVATALRFERRARIFREVHPLALQVILSSGVLNGILVARSVESCAELCRSLIRNELALELVVDDLNYRLVEQTTQSTVRVVSRNQLLRNAFAVFYARERA